MLSILRKARLKDKEMRILMLYVHGKSEFIVTDDEIAVLTMLAKRLLSRRL